MRLETESSLSRSSKASHIEQHSVTERLWRFLLKYRAAIVSLGLSLAITVAVIAFRGKLASLRGYGYAGVFLISLLGNATVVLPVPSLAIVFAGGSVLSPLLVGLVAGLGGPIGELTGYLAGYGGGAVLPEGERTAQMRGFMERRGILTIFVLSAIPNPLFDLAGMTAGILRFPVHKFLIACWLGKTLKALLIAYLGSLSLGAFLPGLS